MRVPVVLLVVLLVVSVIYWPGMRGGFAFDDFPNLVLNTNLHVSTLRRADWIAAVFSSQASELQRPLAMLTFALNHYFTGMDPLPMKVTNLCIHLANTVALFGLIRCLLTALNVGASSTQRGLIAVYSTAVWALLPINMLVVLLVVQRMEGLAQLFVLLGLWAFVAGRSRMVAGRQGLLLAVCGLVFGSAVGALSKESAVLLPVYAFWVELLVFRFGSKNRLPDRRVLLAFVALLALPAVAAMAWLLPRALAPASFGSRNFNLVERLLTETRVLVDYVQWTIAPNLSQLSLFHDDYIVSRGLLQPASTLFAILACFTLLVAAWFLRKRSVLTSLGIAWFFSAHLLTATIIPLELVFEHRNYFASVGLALVLVDVLILAPSSTRFRRPCLLVAVCLVPFYAGMTALRVSEWSNPLRFAQTEAAKHPLSPRATYQLAQTLAILSLGEAGSPFTKQAFAAYARARALPDASISADQGALLLSERTQTPANPDWWLEMQSRLRKHPIGPQELGALGALVNCELVQVCHFPPEQMLATFGAALSHGDNAEVLNIYGNYALNMLNDVPLTERCWRRARQLRPDEPQYVISLAKLMMVLRRDDESRQFIRELRAMGRFGQYGPLADALEVRFAAELNNRRAGDNGEP